MADRKASNDSEKSKDAGNAVRKFIRRLSPTKRCHGSPVAADSSGSPNLGASSSRQKEASAKDTPPKKPKSLKELKMFLSPESKSTSSSKSSLSSLSVPSPWGTPTQSTLLLNIPSEEFEVLKQLHANFGNTAEHLGKYASLERKKK